MKPAPFFFSVARVFAIGALFALGARAHAQTDPLSSWNDSLRLRDPACSTYIGDETELTLS